ncbi:NAD(P)-binding domain-containing protein [Streptomyces sp. NPDC048197]|uniref:NAD(P)-binding domain-containing protein n=1 Tax=Streptomyces sp. NPDC048197 TaxID=3365511 RepID=UPI00371A9FCC
MGHLVTEYLVIGAGPAGLQMAHHLERGGQEYVVLDEGSAPGGFFSRYPRHRQMISNNKRYTGSSDPEYNLRVDWNSLLSDDPDLLFTRYSESYFPQADDFVRYLSDFATKLRLRLKSGCRVTHVSRDQDGFSVTDDHGDTYLAQRVIVATGVSLPNVPDIPGIELADQYATVSVDPDDFTDQRVLIIGKGNAALETADNLIASAAVIHVAGPNPLRLAWHSHFVGHLRAVNNNFLDTYLLKAQNAVLNVGIERIAKADAGYEVDFRFTRGVRPIPYDRVIACTGFRFDAGPFDESCRPALAINDRFPELTGAYESANVEGLHFAGTLTQQLDYRNSTNGFIHGFRYGVRALHRILQERHHGVPWPHQEVVPRTEDLAAAVLDRINRSSGLWQQFGILADVLVVPASGPARYYEEVPVRQLAARGFTDTDDVFAVTLEYGPTPENKVPFDGTILHASEGADFHPVIRHYRAGDLVATCHLASDLENDWRRPDAHVVPLEDFLKSSVAEHATR